jgi:competence protein ComEA
MVAPGVLRRARIGGGLRSLTAAFALFTGLASGLASGLSPALASAQPVPSYVLLQQAAPLEGTVNINTATSAQLELLPGIGPATAKKVLTYRAKHPFKEASHLLRIKGVGRKTFAKLKPYVRVSGPTTLHEVAGS